MPRVVVLWSRPGHLAITEADAWVRSELRSITALTVVADATLTSLGAGPYDWMLELELEDHATIESGPCAEWLGDLRLLGMRPAVVVLGDTVSLTGEA